MNKRILSILLCLMLVVALLVMAVPVNAAPTDVTVTITADKTEANPGDKITFTATLGPVADIASADFKVAIPDGLTYGTATATSGLKDALGFTGGAAFEDMDGTAHFIAYTDDNVTIENDVVLGTFTATVSDDASGTLTVDLSSAKFTDEMAATKGVNTVPATITIGGTEPTDAPVEPTDAPVEPTDAPAEPTDAPVEPTDAPVEPTDAPVVEPTDAPACTHNNAEFNDETEEYYSYYYCPDCGKYYADGTFTDAYDSKEAFKKPVVEPTDAPVEPTDAPVEPTDAPVEPTDAPVEPTDAPVEPTDAPVEPTDAPVEPTDAPVEPTDAPVVEPTDAPVVEPTDAPVVEPTNAPATKDEPSTKDEGTPDQVKPTTPGTKDAASPKTGDSTHMYLWMLIMLASMAGVAGVLYTAKRKGIFTK